MLRLQCGGGRLRSALVTADLELLTATQEAVHFARLPREWRSEERLAEQLAQLLGRGSSFPKERLFLQRTRLGASTGQAVARLEARESPNLQTLKAAFPEEAVLRPLDFQEARNFFDQSRRLRRFTEDLRALVDAPVVTLSGLPETYGPEDVKTMLRETGRVRESEVAAVVFPFDRYGVQQDTAFVRMASEAAAEAVVEAVGEEFPVPMRRVYGANFGCAVVKASRETLFLDASRFPEHLMQWGSCRFTALSLGWRRETSDAQFLREMHKLRIFPETVTATQTASDGKNFLMKFPRIHDVKKCLAKLHRLAIAKKIPRHVVSFAYPVMADFECVGDFKSRSHDQDEDLDEPIDY